MTYRETYTGIREFMSFLGEKITREAKKLRGLSQKVEKIFSSSNISSQRRIKAKKLGFTTKILEDLLLGRIQKPAHDNSFPETSEFEKEIYQDIASEVYRPLIRQEQGIVDVNNLVNMVLGLGCAQCEMFHNFMVKKGIEPEKFYQDIRIAKQETEFDSERNKSINDTSQKLWKGRYESSDLLEGARLVGLKFAERYLDIPRDIHDLKPLLPIIYEKLFLEKNKAIDRVLQRMIAKNYPRELFYN